MINRSTHRAQALPTKAVMPRALALSLMLATTTQPALAATFPEPASSMTTDNATQVGGVIDNVFSGLPVPIDLLTTSHVQVVAYFDATKKLRVKARRAGKDWVEIDIADSYVTYDAHKYLTLSLDDDNYLHLSGNLHYQPMNYFVSSSPLDDKMLLPGETQLPGLRMEKKAFLLDPAKEDQTTYPTFLRGPKGEFLFSYRNQKRHDDLHPGEWYLLKQQGTAYASATNGVPLFKWGDDHYSVYPAFTVSGGYLHVIYMWRTGLDAALNHHLSYMRSSDLVNWTDAFGNPVTLPVMPPAIPLTQADKRTVIEDIPVQRGLFGARLSFDRDGVPILAYHRYEDDGDGDATNDPSEIYVARPQPATQTWKVERVTQDSGVRWKFGGPGSLGSTGFAQHDFGADDPLDGVFPLFARIYGNNFAPQSTIVPSTANGWYLIDESSLTTLAKGATAIASPILPTCASKVEPAAAPLPVDMQTNRVWSRGPSFAGYRYFLRWDSMKANGDVERNPEPAPTQLKLYRTACSFPGIDGNIPPTSEPVSGIEFGHLLTATNAHREGMALKFDSQRASGGYLESATAGTYAQWAIEVASSGEYALGGSVFAQGASSDSFTIEVDGRRVDWHFVARNRWDYVPVTEGVSRSLTRFKLNAGAHTVKLIPREVGARLEYLWLARANDDKRVSRKDLEESNTYPQGTEAYEAVAGYAKRSTASTEQTEFKFPVKVPAGPQGTGLGCYTLLGRHQGGSEYSDSFYYNTRVATAGTNPPPYVLTPQGLDPSWHFPSRGPQWTWSKISELMLPDDSAQDVYVRIKAREAGAGLDSLMLLFKGEPTKMVDSSGGVVVFCKD